MEPAFWDMVASHFGYRDETPTLKTLLLRLLVSDFDQSCRAELPESLKSLVLCPRGAASAVVCLAQWRDSSTRGASYERLSGHVADAIKLEQHLGSLTIDHLAEVKTFLLVEQVIASRLRDQILDTQQTLKPQANRAIAAQRRDGYWATATLPDTAAAPRRTLSAVYDALLAAAELLALRNQSLGGFASADPQGVLSAYCRERGCRWRAAPSRAAVRSAPDADGILPITGTDWLDDDAAHRLVELIAVAWGGGVDSG
ncbi:MULTISPECIES: hypothetical protein [unclassified Thiocapsa]|uniref:hypothetical protein n=1 Tax=unclassified Thiocapsa TaxID=2641286 RepID=UPI0035B2DFE4